MTVSPQWFFPLGFIEGRNNTKNQYWYVGFRNINFNTSILYSKLDNVESK